MHRAKPMIHDNSDVQEIHDGVVTDMRIEAVLYQLIVENWDEPALDQLYTEIVQEFINEDTPTMLVSQAGKNSHQAQGLLYLSLFNLDYEVVHKPSPDWPGPFEYMEEAAYAIRVRYPDRENTYTQWSPGRSLSAAALTALMQLCREISAELYNKDANTSLN